MRSIIAKIQQLGNAKNSKNILGGIFLLLCISLIFFVLFRNFTRLLYVPSSEIVGTSEGVVPPVELFDPFTGEKISTPKEGMQSLCVMVENSADAWPLSGVEDAFFVVEARVEGGIPRFMACFDALQSVSKIGPVRSARPYYVSFAEMFFPVYAHVGGSPDALTQLTKSSSLEDLNEFSFGHLFWRDSGRFAPHNVYTSSEILRDVTQDLPGIALPDFWQFRKISPTESLPACKPLRVSWGGSTVYSVSWECTQSPLPGFVRANALGSPVLASDGDVTHVGTVVFMESVHTVLDEVGRLDIPTIGSGRARVCTYSGCSEGTWERESTTAFPRFSLEGSDEILPFAPGALWFTLVPDLDAVTVGEEFGNFQQ